MKSMLTSSHLITDSETLKALMARDGYLYLQGCLEQGAVLDLREEVLRCCAANGWLLKGEPIFKGLGKTGGRVGGYNSAAFLSLQQRVQATKAFCAVRNSSSIKQLLTGLLGPSWQSGEGDVLRVFLPQSGEVTAPHQDGFYMKAGSEPIWTVWVPLGECSTDVGGLSIKQGSHRQGLLKHTKRGEDEDAQLYDQPSDGWVTSHYHCGDCVIFHPWTIHRGEPNRTTRHLRLSADLRYRATKI